MERREITMKKAFFILALTAILLVGSPSKTQSQDKIAEIGLNLGFMTYPNELGGNAPNDTIPSFGLNIDFHLKKFLMLSPEITLAPGPGLEYLVISPGVLLNYSSRSFWAGAGAVYVILDGFVAPKVNAGYRVKHFVLTGYLVLAKGTLVGASLGYRF